jgi:hypothetical protein
MFSQSAPVLVLSLSSLSVFLLGSCSTTKESASTSEGGERVAEAGEVAAPPKAASALAGKIASETVEIVPEGWDFNYVFDAYKSESNWRQKSGWARNWTRAMDMTGVAWNTDKAGTLITPRHIVMCLSHPHQVGDEVVFHDAEGNPHVRTVEAVSNLGTMKLDFGVALLNEDVPVTPYKLLPPSRDYGKVLPEAGVFVTSARAQLLVAKVNEVRQGHVTYVENEKVREDYRQKLRKEDSGNPSFVRLNGEPVLVSVNSLGGYGGGVFLSDPVVYGGLISMVDALGGGHKIQGIEVDALGGEVAYAAPSGPPSAAPRPPASEGQTVSSKLFQFTGVSSGQAQPTAQPQPQPVGARSAAHSHGDHGHSHGEGGHTH